jgi:SUF system NifU family Fe-S assembly protein
MTEVDSGTPESATTESASTVPTQLIEDLEEAMRDVVDPELGINVVDLGLVYGITVEDDEATVVDVSYDGQGCTISQASASVMADLVIGKTVKEAMVVGDEFLALMQSRGAGEPDEDVLEDAVAFVGVSKYPARIKCALLGWMAWKDATAQTLEKSS